MDAASVASLILTTETAIVEAPKDAAGPAMPDMGGMGGKLLADWIEIVSKEGTYLNVLGV